MLCKAWSCVACYGLLLGRFPRGIGPVYVRDMPTILARLLKQSRSATHKRVSRVTHPDAMFMAWQEYSTFMGPCKCYHGENRQVCRVITVVMVGLTFCVVM